MNGLWKKLGLLYEPDSANSHPKLVSDAANPLAVHLEADVYLIFFNGKSLLRKSRYGISR